jgi:hypothetical protein
MPPRKGATGTRQTGIRFRPLTGPVPRQPTPSLARWTRQTGAEHRCATRAPPRRWAGKPYLRPCELNSSRRSNLRPGGLPIPPDLTPTHFLRACVSTYRPSSQNWRRYWDLGSLGHGPVWGAFATFLQHSVLRAIAVASEHNAWDTDIGLSNAGRQNNLVRSADQNLG